MGSNRHPGEPGVISPDPGPDDCDELADVELEYRGRGRPRLSPELKRREKLVLSLTRDELRRIMVAAARDAAGPLSPQDWSRGVLLGAAPPLKDE